MELRQALKEQYHAGLAMLSECVEKCPEEMWLQGEHPRALWRIVFHAAFFTQLYLGQNEQTFAPCPARITCILVGDLFYERAAASALWAWLCTAHRQGVQVLIADASRPFVPTAGVRGLWEERLATAWAWEGTRPRTVRLLTLDI